MPVLAINGGFITYHEVSAQKSVRLKGVSILWQLKPIEWRVQEELLEGRRQPQFARNKYKTDVILQPIPLPEKSALLHNLQTRVDAGQKKIAQPLLRILKLDKESSCFSRLTLRFLI